MRVTIDKLGRIVVPKGIRRELGLEPGTALEATVEGGRLIAEPVGSEVDLIEDDGLLVARTAQPAAPLTAADVSQAIDEMRGWPRRF